MFWINPAAHALGATKQPWKRRGGWGLCFHGFMDVYGCPERKL